MEQRIISSSRTNGLRFQCNCSITNQSDTHSSKSYLSRALQSSRCFTSEFLANIKRRHSTSSPADGQSTGPQKSHLKAHHRREPNSIAKEASLRQHNPSPTAPNHKKTGRKCQNQIFPLSKIDL